MRFSRYGRTHTERVGSRGASVLEHVLEAVEGVHGGAEPEAGADSATPTLARPHEARAASQLAAVGCLLATPPSGSSRVGPRRVAMPRRRPGVLS